MTIYSIQFMPAVEKDLRDLPRSVLLRVFKQIIALQEDPLPHQAIKLVGVERLYRVRIGDYRIVYEVDRDLTRIIIHYVRHRSDVYRDL
ncbi:MAG: type II toxin-antitoxin system RelE/ParE family toxin [Anaerolinea sp.]|nr:type II toxin-antitoxin system RelE/ParE family toxin [Anaerolinea sp.]